jgi:glycosyltransferase involved in cell wall biosynthesis
VARQAGINARWYGLDAAAREHVPTDPEATVLVVRLLTGSDERSIDRWLSEWRRRVLAVIYEADDVFYGPEMVDHLDEAGFMQGRSRSDLIHQGEMARYLASQCDGVVVSSEPLAELIRADVARPVVVLANAIDTRWFRSQMAHRPAWANRLTIGWCGGRRPEADVTPMAVAWGRIARRYPHVRFVVAAPLVPDVFYQHVEDDTQIIRYGWVPWEDAPALYQVDIGCVAVADSPFSRCKTPIKLYEYAVAGAAVVGTDLLYGDCLAHGGSVAETADDWEQALSYLVERRETRELQGASLLEHVEQRHALDQCLHRWPQAYAQVVESAAGVPA